jgi:adenylyl-sulfate kinase
MSDAPGFIVWLEGLPGAGKSTISQSVAKDLRARGRKVEILDGDEVRQMFSPELCFSRKDREMHARRVSYVANRLARNGVAVLVAMVTPYETSRQAARGVAEVPFHEVWLKCSAEVLRQRDPKGLYRRTAEGSISRLSGVDDPFEEPLNPDLVVDSTTASIADCTSAILRTLSAKELAA